MTTHKNSLKGGAPIFPYPGSASPYGVRLPFPTFDGEGGGNGDPDPNPVPKFNLQEALADEPSRKALNEWAEREVAKGLKVKNEELLGKLNKYKYKDEESGEERYLDPEEVRTALEFYKSKGDVNTEEAIQKAVSTAVEKKDREIEQRDKTISDLNTTLEQERAGRHRIMVGHELDSSLIESGIKPGKMHLHHMYLEQFVSIEKDDDGKERMIVLDENGDVRYGNKGAMTVAELVEEYSQKEGVSEDWNPNANNGSGTKPGEFRRRSGPVIDQNLPPQERLRLQRRAQAAGHTIRR